MNFNILTGRENNSLVDFEQSIVHKYIISDFLKLRELAKKEIDADIQIISSYRSFEKQKQIWNLKASGQRTLFDKDEKELNFKSLSHSQIIKAITLWSAIPGASRHHWGTDIDIFDANQLKKEYVKLLASECTGLGPCAKLHTWLDTKILEKKSFGFFRPYDTERGGVGVEKWHLSYSPISTDYINHYTLDFFKKNLDASDIILQEQLIEESKNLFENLVLNIDPSPYI